MGILHKLIESVGFALNVVGAMITVWGTAIALFDFLKKEVSLKGDSVRGNEAIRLKLGSYLVLALEFFIAGDVVKTIMMPDWRGLALLGVIVVIRILLSYFLTKDFKEDLETVRKKERG